MIRVTHDWTETALHLRLCASRPDVVHERGSQVWIAGPVGLGVSHDRTQDN